MPAVDLLKEQRAERDDWIRKLSASSAIFYYLRGYEAGYRRKSVEDRVVPPVRPTARPRVCAPVCSAPPRRVGTVGLYPNLQGILNSDKETVDPELIALVKYTGWERFRRFPLFERITILLGIAAIIVMLIASLVHILPVIIQLVQSVEIIPYAYAADSASANGASIISIIQTINMKTALGIVLTAILTGILIWCMCVEFYSSNPKSIASAKDYNKILFGFVIASVKNYLGA